MDLSELRVENYIPAPLSGITSSCVNILARIS